MQHRLNLIPPTLFQTTTDDIRNVSEIIYKDLRLTVVVIISGTCLGSQFRGRLTWCSEWGSTNRWLGCLQWSRCQMWVTAAATDLWDLLRKTVCLTRNEVLVILLQLNGGVVSLSMEEIRRAYPDVRSLVGNSVYVKASVLTKSGKHTTGLSYEVNPLIWNQLCCGMFIVTVP